MGRVTVDTSGRHEKPAGQQPLSVDAHPVVANNLVLGPSVASGRLSAFLVAFSTQVGNVLGERRGVEVLMALLVVMFVAVAAGGSIVDTLSTQLAMDAFLILRDGLRMTDGAVDRSAVLADGASTRADVRVAPDAGARRMNRMADALFVHKE